MAESEAVPVVVHGGRRYRRTQGNAREDNAESAERGDRAGRGRHHDLARSAVRQLHIPQVPLHPLTSRDIPSAMLITSPTVTFETSPFQVTESTPQLCMHILVKELGKSFIIYTQRYKPLPAIGSTTDLPPHLPGDHSRPDPPSSKPVTVCVRLPDGGRCEVTLPLSSPLSSLVAAAFSDGGRQQEAPGGVVKQGGPEGQGWVLCTSEVPKRELRNLSLSLQETGLTTPCILHLVPS